MIHIYCRKLKGIEKYLPTILKSRDNVIMSLLNFYLAYVVLSNWVMLYIKFFIICFLFKLTEAFPGIMKNPQVCVLVFFFFWWDGVWTQGFTLGKAGTLLLELLFSPFCCGYFGDGDRELFAQACLELLPSQSQPPKYIFLITTRESILS
jgi:hypothetical protein